MVDPFEKTYWNIAQTLAWVCLGDISVVREADDDASPTRTFMKSLSTPSGELVMVEETASRPGLLRIELLSSSNGEAVSLSDAIDSILVALRAGRIQASGVLNGNGERVVIPPMSWIDLKFFDGRHGYIYAAPQETPRHYDTGWSSVQFCRSQILSLWPAPLSSADSERNNSENCVKRAAREYAEPYWSGWRVISWLAYKEQARICAIEDSNTLRSLGFYETIPDERVDKSPANSLRILLQNGNIEAIALDGRTLKANEWAHHSAHDATTFDWNCVRFKRADIITRCPPKADDEQTAPGTAMKKKRPKPRGGYFNDLCTLVKIPEVRSGLAAESQRKQAAIVRRQWPVRKYRTQLPIKTERDSTLCAAINDALSATAPKGRP